MLEIPIDLNDTVLLGSSSSISKSKEIISQLRINFDRFKFNKFAYESCLKLTYCADEIYVSKADVIN